MSFRHPRVLAWEERLKEIFDRIDHELEEAYGGRYELHPARPPKGETANPAADGLFNVGASFTPGYGSETGRGYVINVQMSTLEQVPADVREAIMDEVVERLGELLPEIFPGTDLRIVRDGPVYKITGDLAF